MAINDTIIFNSKLLSALIKNRNITHTPVADFAECNVTLISYLKSGKHTTTNMRVIYLLAKFFDMKMEDFIVDKIASER